MRNYGDRLGQMKSEMIREKTHFHDHAQPESFIEAEIQIICFDETLQLTIQSSPPKNYGSFSLKHVAKEKKKKKSDFLNKFRRFRRDIKFRKIQVGCWQLCSCINC